MEVIIFHSLKYLYITPNVLRLCPLLCVPPERSAFALVYCVLMERTEYPRSYIALLYELLYMYIYHSRQPPPSSLPPLVVHTIHTYLHNYSHAPLPPSSATSSVPTPPIFFSVGKHAPNWTQRGDFKIGLCMVGFVMKIPHFLFSQTILGMWCKKK